MSDLKIETKEIKGDLFVSVTDIAKIYKNRFKKPINVATMLVDVPCNLKHTKKGYKGCSFLSVSALDTFFFSRRVFTVDFVNSIYDALDLTSQYICESRESSFGTLLESFLDKVIPNHKMIRQFGFNGKVYDFCVFDKILIEFDENNHKNCIENDKEKDLLAELNGYHLFRVNSQNLYGGSLGDLYLSIVSVLKNKI